MRTRSALGPSTTSPGKSPAWAAAGAASATTAVMTEIRRRGSKVRSSRAMRPGSQPRWGAEVSALGRTGRRADDKPLSGAFCPPAVDLRVDPGLVPAVLGAHGGRHPVGGALVQRAGGQEAQAGAAQEHVAD